MAAYAAVERMRRALARRARGLRSAVKRRVLLAADTLAAPLALALADAALAVPPRPWTEFAAAALAALAVSLHFGLHRIKLNAWDLRAVLRSAGGAAAVAACLGTGMALAGRGLPVAGLALFGLTMLVLVVGGRIAALQLLLWALRADLPVRRVVIYGAGTTGVQLARALAQDRGIRAVAFIDDDPGLHRLSACGLPILPPAALPGLVRQGVDRAILAMPSVPLPRLRQIADGLAGLGLAVMAVPSFAQLVGEDALVATLAPVPPARLLGRPAGAETLAPAAQAYAGRTVLVTGAGGSVGSELCRQILAMRPRRLVLLELSEVALYAIDRDLRDLADGWLDAPEIVPVLGSAADPRLAQALLTAHGVDAVLHAAAYKHVPLIEANPIAGLENNVEGTRVMAEAARAAGVARFVLISTDKAVRPQGVMGATKRMAELIVQDIAAAAPGTAYAIVRFGNVLGSSGSVLPRFRDQIARGGPVTLTHEDVTRYFMTVEEAARLVLQAAVLPARPGTAAILALDMGPPLRIRDLALRMIAAAGLTLRDAAHPGGDIEIVVTGLRPGEKLHEEPLIPEDAEPTAHPRILRIPDAPLSPGTLAALGAALQMARVHGDAEAARRLLRSLSAHAMRPRGISAAIAAA